MGEHTVSGACQSLPNRARWPTDNFASCRHSCSALDMRPARNPGKLQVAKRSQDWHMDPWACVWPWVGVTKGHEEGPCLLLLTEIIPGSQVGPEGRKAVVLSLRMHVPAAWIEVADYASCCNSCCKDVCRRSRTHTQLMRFSKPVLADQARTSATMQRTT